MDHQKAWPLPNAAWEAVCQHLTLADLLVARLVCHAWHRDLGAFVQTATAIPSLMVLAGLAANVADCMDHHHADSSPSSPHLPPEVLDKLTSAARALASHKAGLQATSKRFQELQLGSACAVEGTASEALVADEGVTAASAARGVCRLLEAFPHCDKIVVDISSRQEQQLAHLVINTVGARAAGSSATAAAETSGAAFSDCDTSNGSSSSSSRSVMLSTLTPFLSTHPRLLLDALPPTAPSTFAAAADLQLQQLQQHQPQVVCLAAARCPSICLSALQRSFHCHSRQDYPAASPEAGPLLFTVLLQQLPRQLNPAALSAVRSLQLDVFPERSQDWLLLQSMPCLQELVLPYFKPALPHEQLLGIAGLTQLQELTLSVQGSFTAWRANCAAFASLSHLVQLRKLSLHAFHCPGAHLAAAVSNLERLEVLQLSGRVVLDPLRCVMGLTRLHTLGLTQDVQYSVLCDLAHSLTGLTHLAVGRVTLPPPTSTLAAAAAAAADPLQPWIAAAQAVVAQQPGAAAAAVAAVGGDGGGGAVAAPGHVALGAAAAAGVLPLHPPAPVGQPAAAAAAAGNQAAAAFGGLQAAAAVAAADGHVGEVMLEDVGAIVDGLIGNLQEGAVPVHLQRIIERFESIIQLDLTRRTASSPWSWPVAGVELLQELKELRLCQLNQQHHQCGQAGSSGDDAADLQQQWPCDDSNSSQRNSSAGGAVRNGGGISRGCVGLELALLKPADAGRLFELPQQLRCCQHLGLRLRDQLLAFASVCPVRLQPGQLSGLGAAFSSLASLAVCGKVAVDGPVLLELAAGLSRSSNGMRLFGKASNTATAIVTTITPAAAAAAAAPTTASSSSCDGGISSAALPDMSRAVHCSAAPSPTNGLPTAWGAASKGLVCLSLDCHFVNVSAACVTAALQQLSGLKVLSLLHRGGGKLPLPLSALPASLHTLAVKKVMLFQQPLRSQQTGAVASSIPSVVLPAAATTGSASGIFADGAAGVSCHAITSPGFRRAAAEVQFAGGLDSGCGSGRSSPEQHQQPLQGVVDEANATAVAGTGPGTPSPIQQPVQSRLQLRSLHLKNCLVASDAVPALLGVSANTVRPATGARLAASTAADSGLAAPVPLATQFGFASSSINDVASGSNNSSSPLCSICGGSASQLPHSSSSSSGSACRSQLRRLLIAGDSPTPGEAAEGWGLWLAAIRQLKALQVLDIAVPDVLGSSVPTELLAVLLGLPRLSHLHLTTSHYPEQLLFLTQLQLRMLGINYTGPPAIPPQLMDQLQLGLGTSCKVQIWEQLVMQQSDSFGSTVGQDAADAAGIGVAAGAGAAGDEEGPIVGGHGRPGRRSRMDVLKVLRPVAGFLSYAGPAAAGWWLGWRLTGSFLRKKLQKRAQQQQQGEQQ